MKGKKNSFIGGFKLGGEQPDSGYEKQFEVIGKLSTTTKHKLVILHQWGPVQTKFLKQIGVSGWTAEETDNTEDHRHS